MNLRKPIHVGRFSIPALLLLATIVTSVAAVAYVVLQATINATVVANPKVCFLEYPNTRRNTFTYAVNIFPGVKTVDENMTHGIYNFDTPPHTVGLRVSAISNSGNIASWTLKVSNASDIWTLSSIAAFDYKVLAKGVYKMSIEITAAGGAVVGQTSAFTLEMRVENP